MTAPIFLSLVLHNHQPVGQFGFVNEHCVETAYKPFVALMERHPAIKCGIHFTGSLLDYLIEHQQPLLARVRALVERDQLEVLSGGYYEPLLTTLPDADKIAQIQKLSATVGEQFGMKPRGMWLAERVWEPHLVRPIAQAGTEYVIIDDTHFEAVGFNKEKELFGYFVSEEQGYTVRVFPTLSFLRYAIPWDTVENVIDWLRYQAEKPLANFQPKLAFMGDDGEKFGVWPGTYDHNWGEDSQYMEKLFSAFEANADWVQTIRPADYIDQYPALGRVYLPTASYFEMGQWSLPPERYRELERIKEEFEEQGREDVLRYLRGSIWRNFMVKYDEVNHMNKRMLMVADKVHAMPEGADKSRALDLLWRAQANDAYWHGLFGGIYLFNFRVANYANLIEAEALAEGANAPLNVRQFDFNKDSTDEITLTGDPFNAIWKPNTGGAMLELDYRPLRYNVLNIMTRREEGYHEEIREGAEKGTLATPEVIAQSTEWEMRDAVRVKEAGIEQYLLYDWYRRGGFIDHFLREDVDIDSFYRAFYGEQGDFVNLPYDAEVQAGDDEATIALGRAGHVWVGEQHIPIHVGKTFTFHRGKNDYQVTYTVLNQSDQAIELRFAVELASGFDGGQDMRYCHYTINGGAEKLALADVLEHPAVTEHSSFTTIRDLKLTTRLNQPCTLWTFPLETVTNSEAGYERGYQGTVYLHVWELQLAPGAAWQNSISQAVTAYNG
jgi:alpha-amylase/alpha-mannosidase (GH57 family)